MRDALQILGGIAGLLLLLGAGLWLAMIHMPGRSRPWDGATDLEQLAAARLAYDVRHLAIAIGERSVYRPQGLEAARRYVHDHFASLGYAVREDAFESEGVEVRNVEATWPGADAGAGVVVVGAHYDAVAGTVGANDNASGVAALLELGRRLPNVPLARAVRLVAFVNEEQPFFGRGEMGSQHYARAAAARGERIEAMLSLETIGWYDDAAGSQRYPFPFGLFYPDRGDFVAFVGNLASRRLVRRSVGAFRAAVAFPAEGLAAPASVPGVAWSDHASFWPYGVPAVMVTDTAPYRYPHYHAPSDRPEHLGYARMARVVSGLEAVIRELAQHAR